MLQAARSKGQIWTRVKRTGGSYKQIVVRVRCLSATSSLTPSLSPGINSPNSATYEPRHITRMLIATIED